MAGVPIKLFANRAERSPQPTDADMIQDCARAALAAMGDPHRRALNGAFPFGEP
jgi:hypothetical protein